MTLTPGSTLGPYTLAQALGRGSSATVFLARGAAGDVAIKVRGRGDAELDRRFLREFEALRGLSVPGVVRVHDAGIDDRFLWYVMDVVHGTPIRSWIEAGGAMAARVQRLLHVAAPLCDALAGIHRAGILHRDLKPSNVLVDSHGLPHVLDFGVARSWVDGDPLTTRNGLVGTLPFMSPEQVGGQPLTARSDMFALGLIFYEGLVGKRPRPPRTQDWLRIQCLDRPRPLATLEPSVPLELSHLLDRLLALDPRDRPDANTAASLFRACAEGRGRREWPEPHSYVGEPPLVTAADQWLRGAGPRVMVLAGPTGSGRRRAAEQVRRRALLVGHRTIRGRCRVEQPGGVIEELLEGLLEAPADAAWRRKVGGSDTGPLLEMWPHLPLEPLPGPGFAATAQDVVRAASSALTRATGGGLLLVIEDLDEIDRFTARLLERLARVAPKELSILCTVDDRHATRRCHRMINELVRLELASLQRLSDLDAPSAERVAKQLVPDGVPVQASAGSPLLARETGIEALARSRGMATPRLPPAAFPAALERRPLHAAGWQALGVDPEVLTAQGVLERVAPQRFAVATELIRAGALARLVRRAYEARRLAEAWAQDPSSARHAARARAFLLAEDSASAFAPAVHAALEAERAGRYREARDWLVLVDSLPRDRASEDYQRLRFSLAAARASVAAAIGSERPRDDLVASALSRVTTDTERLVVTQLAADLRRRKGDRRGALAAWLKVLARGEQAPNLIASTAVRVAGARLAAGEGPEAAAALDRAEQLRGGWRGDADQVQIDAARADVAMAAQELGKAVELTQRGLRLATGLGHLPGIAAHSQRLGLCLAWLGDRPGAESSLERARRARFEAGERGGAAEATAWLGWLLVGRGDSATAGLLGEEALTVARRLNLDEVRSLALAVCLSVAAVRGDETAAIRAVEEHEGLEKGAVWRASEARFWRVMGEPARAAAVPAAPHAPAWFVLELEIERARAVGALGDRRPAAAALAAAAKVAGDHGFRELALYARVARAAYEPPERATWDALVEEARTSGWIEVFLWILELDGARRAIRGDVIGARRRFLELAARANEHGHVPLRRAAEEALGTG